MLNGHIPTTSDNRVLRRYLDYTANEQLFGCYSIGDTVQAPHVMEKIFQPEVLDTATKYLGCTPLLSWLQVWWNFPQETDFAPKFFHRDANDFRMCWMYTYLTDVDEDCGPHKVIRRSGNPEVVEEYLNRGKSNPKIRDVVKDLKPLDFFERDGYVLHGKGVTTEVFEELFGDLVTTVTGRAGTTFMSLGNHFHRIAAPLLKKRSILATRFVINDFIDPGPARDNDLIPAEFFTDQIGNDEQIKHITKMRFDWNNRPAA